jgi:hypothetical protein
MVELDKLADLRVWRKGGEGWGVGGVTPWTATGCGYIGYALGDLIRRKWNTSKFPSWGKF